MSPSVAGTGLIEGCSTRSKTRVKWPGGRAASCWAAVHRSLRACALSSALAQRGTVATKAPAASAAPTHRTTRERNCILWNILVSMLRFLIFLEFFYRLFRSIGYRTLPIERPIIRLASVTSAIASIAFGALSGLSRYTINSRCDIISPPGRSFFMF
jgi:hypothetical protein